MPSSSSLPNFLLGHSCSGAADKINDSLNKKEQSVSIKEIRFKTEELVASIEKAQSLIINITDKINPISEKSDLALKSIKDIEGRSKQLSDNLDEATRRIADSLDKAGQQISDQIKTKVAFIKQEMKKSTNFNQKKMDEFSANANRQADNIQMEIRSSANSIRSSQMLNENNNSYGYGYSIQNSSPRVFCLWAETA